jgi:uncharacterized protein with HEPN domain
MKDKVYLERIQAYCIRINTYMRGVQTVHEWISDQQKVDSVMLNLEQIGETAKKLSIQTKTQFPSIHWPSIIGLRNMISHQYEGVKLQIVYEIVMKNIPTLLQILLDSVH